MHCHHPVVQIQLPLADKPELKVTPMIGGVFGKKTAIAPGYLGAFNYKGIALYSQGEFVVDSAEKAGNFFYARSELRIERSEGFSRRALPKGIGSHNLCV